MIVNCYVEGYRRFCHLSETTRTNQAHDRAIMYTAIDACMCTRKSAPEQDVSMHERIDAHRSQHIMRTPKLSSTSRFDRVKLGILFPEEMTGNVRVNFVQLSLHVPTSFAIAGQLYLSRSPVSVQCQRRSCFCTQTPPWPSPTSFAFAGQSYLSCSLVSVQCQRRLSCKTQTTP